MGCQCEKRNGLQDDCPRSDCQGSPECLARPNPTCGPSEYADGKHLTKKLLRAGRKGADAAAADTSEDDGCVEEEYQCFPAYVKGI